MRFFDSIILSAFACYILISEYFASNNHPVLTALILTFLYFTVNLFPSLYNFKIKDIKMHILADGTDLLSAYLIASTFVSVAYIVLLVKGALSSVSILTLCISIIVSLVSLAIAFYSAIARVCFLSKQLKISHKVLAVIFGVFPVINLGALFYAINTASKEVEFETSKQKLNEERKNKEICRTKYPILLVHGVFFRDFKHFNYWGRIPEELSKNGARLFYGNHQSASSVADSAAELTDRIKEILAETNCEKVNVIAHSKGGLDCRYAISKCGADKYVASLTTVNTPHRGCAFADYLLEKIPEKTKNKVAAAYNGAMKKLGDPNPDFLEAVVDLTYEKCCQFNENVPDKDGVYYQSTGSKLNKAKNGKFPLNLSYHLVNCFDGANDGLVAENSFKWGENYTFVTTKGRRGISHADMIDLNRENFAGFDVREFYVQLVYDLKKKGF